MVARRNWVVGAVMLAAVGALWGVIRWRGTECSPGEMPGRRAGADEGWAGHWAVPEGVANEVVALYSGACARQDRLTCAARSIVDELVPTEERGKLTLDRDVSATGSVSLHSFGNGDNVLTLEFGSGKTDGTIMIDVLPCERVRSRAEAAVMGRIKRGMKALFHDRIGAEASEVVEVVVVEYTPPGDVEGWIVGTYSITKIVPNRRLLHAEKEQFMGAMARVGLSASKIDRRLSNVSVSVRTGR